MKIVVLGHLVLDEIHAADGAVYESLGGIAFPLYAFSALMDEDDTAYAVLPIGADAADIVFRNLAVLPGIRLDGCYSVPEPSTRVRLFHDAQSQYNTRLLHSAESIPFQSVEPYLAGTDLIYVNMMTADDVTAETLSLIRRHTNALIYLDVHMIAYQVGKDGSRSPRDVPFWKDWVEHVDIVQYNEREARAFVPGYDNESERAAAIFDQTGVDRIVLTQGALGVVLFSRTGDELRIPPYPAPTIIDSTGCGDVYGTTFAYLYARTGSPVEAGIKAAKAAAYTLSIPGSEGLDKLRDFLQGSA